MRDRADAVAEIVYFVRVRHFNDFTPDDFIGVAFSEHICECLIHEYEPFSIIDRQCHRRVFDQFSILPFCLHAVGNIYQGPKRGPFAIPHYRYAADHYDDFGTVDPYPATFHHRGDFAIVHDA